MNYKSYSDLSHDVRAWLKTLPNNYDLIVGIPRSGLIPAGMIALSTNLPLTDIDGLINKRLLKSGLRLDDNNLFSKNKKLNILIIDDSINTGAQIKIIKKIIYDNNLSHNIDYAAVYASKKSEKNVKYFYQVVKQPRCFEWNIFHHSLINNSCVDIDGILCRDPTNNENDDGINYEDFIINVKPLIKPTVKIGWIVTCRLEKYRHITEEWLKNNGIVYDKLIMMDLPSKSARILLNNHAEFKANVYGQTRAKLFIESSGEQAIKIAQLSGRFVYSYENNKIIKPDLYKNTLMVCNDNLIHLKNDPIQTAIHFLKKIKHYFQ